MPLVSSSVVNKNKAKFAPNLLAKKRRPSIAGTSAVPDAGSAASRPDSAIVESEPIPAVSAPSVSQPVVQSSVTIEHHERDIEKDQVVSTPLESITEDQENQEPPAAAAIQSTGPSKTKMDAAERKQRMASLKEKRQKLRALAGTVSSEKPTSASPLISSSSATPAQFTQEAIEINANFSSDEDRETAGAQAERQADASESPKETVTPIVKPLIMADLCRASFLKKRKRRGARNEQGAEDQNGESAGMDRPDGQPVGASGSSTENIQQNNGESAPTENYAGPLVRVIDGNIVLDQSSLLVSHDPIRDATNGDLRQVEEQHEDRHITAATYMKMDRGSRWTADEDSLFYKGLQCFGTDFQMISHLFPKRTRQQIKKKFNREERQNPTMVDAMLRRKRTPQELGIQSLLSPDPPTAP